MRELSVSNYILDPEDDLLRSSLLISRYIEYPQLDVEGYILKVNAMARELLFCVDDESNTFSKIKLINNYLFTVKGFEGNKKDYYNPKNSFINDVIDSKKGIPITLSIIYMHVSRLVGLDVKGICFPGHFLVKVYDDGQSFIIDPYNKGEVVTKEKCLYILGELFGDDVEFEERFLESSSNTQILKRVVNNLKNIYVMTKEYQKSFKTVDIMMSLDPYDPQLLIERAFIGMKLECFSQALRDFEKCFENSQDISFDEDIGIYISFLRDKVERLN